MLRRLVYLSRIELPNRRSHSIQMLRTCQALAEAGVAVEFLWRAREPVDGETIRDYYGLPRLASLTLRGLPPGDWEHFAFFRRALGLAWRSRAGAVFYTRDFHLARRLIRLRPLLRLPVLVETHMLDGFFDRQYVPQWVREAVAGRSPDPRATEWFRLVDACYRRADGVVSLLGSTARVLRQSYPATPFVEIWHGTAPDPAPSYDPTTRQGVYYVGNLYDYYQPDTLIEAMRLLPGHELFLVGGNDESDVARVRACAERAGVADRVGFLGHVAPTQLSDFYRRCRVVVSLFAGQKIAEYLSRGLPIVAPSLPIVPDILRDGETCLLFAPGDPASLASALRRILSDGGLAQRLAAGALAEAQKHTQPDRARRLIQFIEGLL
jgi:glycosyltransferase involved in cell wall biosynthesis